MHIRNTGSAPTLEDCLRAADETQELILRKGALKEIPAVLRAYFDKAASCLLVACEFTYAAAGERVRALLEREGIPVHTHIFPGTPRLHADYTHVHTLISRLSSFPPHTPIVPLAVGSGTINDLVKRAAFERSLPYLCIPTAASVDGYTANGAALLCDGFKQTFPCTAPKVVATDPVVLAHAPAYLSSSGFGDLASKIIAGTDWIIAEKAGALGAPGAEPINEKAWAMTQPGILDALHRSVNAARGDEDAVSALFGALAVTGFAMQYHKNSRPVSSAEHSFSHVWEMEDLSVRGVPVTHGHKVTIGTLAVTAFTELFFADPEGPPPVPKDFRRPALAERKTEVAAAFRGSRSQASALKTASEKYMEDPQAEKVNAGFRDSWKDIRDQVIERLLPYKDLSSLLENAGCPLRPEAINLSRTEAIATARRAQMIRNKYSVLDLAWDMGNFETILSRLEASERYLR
ncbi:MAG: sn-glycerol-1-phosphate dehydrogenase [Treponema sp.]|jgi:glycerol-1-phosphate dehydrogenase [NAD(P)+]|nr:sn-glycerol-1-phosphate dehydrogenase [Treponema sp.]